jgi:hypothetical protein
MRLSDFASCGVTYLGTWRERDGYIYYIYVERIYIKALTYLYEQTVISFTWTSCPYSTVPVIHENLFFCVLIWRHNFKHLPTHSLATGVFVKFRIISFSSFVIKRMWFQPHHKRNLVSKIRTGESHRRKKVSTSTVKGFTWKADSHSTGQEIYCLHELEGT